MIEGLVGIMLPNWSFVIKVDLTFSVMLEAMVIMIINDKNGGKNMITTVVKSILLTVGTSLLGRPISGVFPT